MDLQGKKILVTRAKAQASALSLQIMKNNGVPVEMPLITCKSISDKKAIHKAIEELHTYDWLVFTSKNGIDFFFDEIDKKIGGIVIPTTCKIAVVGKKTEEIIENYRVKVDLIPENFVAESLLESLLKVVKKDEKVLIPRGNLARNIIQENLRNNGIDVTDLVVYENIVESKSKQRLLSAIENQEIDIVTFTSSSTVDNFVQLLEGTNWRKYIDHIIFASIGPITSRTMIKHQLPVHIEPEEYTLHGMLNSIMDKLKEE
jgi:uroporphyrinogen-III synthase